MGHQPPIEVTSARPVWLVPARRGRERESSAGYGVAERLGLLAFAGALR